MRNFVGYGEHPPAVNWFKKAKIAINFVVNYEEGAEANILDGDLASECFLAEIAGLNSSKGTRNFFTESIFEYGSRAGIWRLLNLFAEFDIPITVFATGLALERNHELSNFLAKSKHEIVGHGYRWIDYSSMSKEEEREHIRLTLSAIKTLTDKQPMGWYTGRCSHHTRELIVEAGLLYDSDNYADDLPYWTLVSNNPHLIIPYTFDNNDAKFSMSPGWMSGDDFFRYLCLSFDCLYREGASFPKMMTIALHGRLSGRPGRAEAIKRFIEYILKHNDVWLCTRAEIAGYWIENHPYIKASGINTNSNLHFDLLANHGK